MSTTQQEREAFLSDMKIIGGREGWELSECSWCEFREQWSDMYANWMWWAWRQARAALSPVGINGLTDAETNATASVMGLSPVARPLTEAEALSADAINHAISNASDPHSLCRNLWNQWCAQHVAQPAEAVGGWLPIESAAENMDKCVVVQWIDSEGQEHHDFDYTEDGCWIKWHEHAEHVEMIGGHGVSYTPPYEHFMPLPPAPQPKEPT